jgi:lysophospholipase L1-like esterase
MSRILLPAVLFTLVVTISALAQNARPADRNAVNSPVKSRGMAADSPVQFPESGALPAKFAPDGGGEQLPVEDGYILATSLFRTSAQIAKIRATMPSGAFKSPPTDWQYLPRTRRILKEGGPLHVMGIGDSIVADTMRSGWLSKLQDAYPKAQIRGTVYVKGGGGCQHYKEEGRIAKYVVPLKPDLVFIGGISQRDVESIGEVIHQLRAGLPDVEIVLTTGTFGTVDPRDLKALTAPGYPGPGEYGAKLKQLAVDEKCAYLDMNTPWAEYIRFAKVHPHLFYRDVVHANEYGEQILARILLMFFRDA